ncbi:TPA: Mitotic-spindle organizing protein 1 [Trebouxia sp. C0004]
MDHVAVQEANEALDTIHQISQILDTGLDKETLSILTALCESGVNPEALAAVVRELRREAARLKSEQSKQQAAKASVS